MKDATTAQAISAAPPDVDATALAPIPEKDAAASVINDPDFQTFLNRIADFATNESNSPAQWERRRKSVKLRKYCCGEYFGIFDKSRGWVSGKEEGDGIYFAPETATFIEDVVATLVKTKPVKLCRARATDRVDKREAARVAEKLLALDDEQDFTPKKQQREWKYNLLTAGETYRITYFNSEKAGCGFDQDVYEPLEIKGGDKAVYCPLCSSTVADEAGKCAECGNPQMDSFEAQSTTVQIKKTAQYKQVGDVDYDVPDALEMTVIGDTDAVDEALVVLRDRMIPRCVLQDALGLEAVDSTGTPDTLHYKQLFDSGKDYGSESPEFEEIHYQELWLAPAVYSGFTFPSAMKTKGGVTIPAGTKAKDIFPKGLYYSRTKKTIQQLLPQGIAECITHAANSIGEGFHGQGEWDLAELQDQATEAKSLKMNSMLLDSTTPLLVRTGIIDTDNLENKPGLIVPVSQQGQEIQLKDIMARVPAAQMPTEAYQLGEQLKGEMQSRVGAFSTSTDSPDIKAMGTATGISAIYEKTTGRRAPALQLYAQMEIEQAYQKLELRQRYWPARMYDTIAKDLGTDAVKWFMKCNIRQDISITVGQDSWMPKTDMQKQVGFQQFLATTGQILAAKQDPKLLDEVVRKSNEIYGAGINFADFETEQVEAQIRLDKLREVASFVENQMSGDAYLPAGIANPEGLMIVYRYTAEMLRLAFPPADEADIFAGLPIDAMFDNHSEFEEVYTDWLRTAEGRSDSLFVRTVVRQLADYHVQAIAFRAMREKQFANLAMLPDLQAELVASDATHDQQLQHQAEDTEQQMLYGGIQQAMAPPEEGTAPPQ